MDCLECHERLYAFLDRELSEAELAEVKVHLGECTGCEDTVVFEQRFLDHLRDCCTGDRAPTDLRERIVMHLRGTPPSA